MTLSGGGFDVPVKKDRLAELQQTTEQEGFWDDPKKAGQITRDLNALRQIIEKHDTIAREISDLESIGELLQETSDQELESEAQTRLTHLEKSLNDLEFQQMLSGEHDVRSAILSINAGAGGTESCDWAEMLLRMYRRWSDQHGYKNEVLDFTPGDQAGFRSVTLTVDGAYAFGYLKAEVGVHRLVRISPFDANKRRHTSFASVFVIPDIEDEVDIEIREEDLRIDTFRSSGAGGQKVNKTDSAVRITHLPTGIVVACQNERSQHRNKDTAMKVLKAKLYEKEMEKRAQEKDAIEAAKKDIAWGSQIRSYVLQPYRLIKDHRTNLEVGDTDRVLDGDLDPFMKSYLLKN